MNSLTALLLISLPCAILADDFQGDVYSLDAKANSVTLSSKKGMKTYRVRPNTEITINGVKGKFEDLNTGMTAKVVSADPSIASRIVAVGVPNRSPGTDQDADHALTEKLRNTRWKLSDTDGATFTLHTDGSTNLSSAQSQGHVEGYRRKHN